MRRKILAITFGTLVFFVLCISLVFIISVNQSKNIVKLIDEKNYDALESACESALFIDKIPVYSQMVNVLAEVNVWTPLQEACLRNDTKAVTILLENGANPNKTPFFKSPWYTPVQIAASNGNVDMMAVLIEHGADIESSGHYALVVLTKKARYGKDHAISLEVYKAGYELLEKHGMNASHSSFDERPLLCEAALLSDIEVTNYLISEKGLSATVCDSDGRTLLHFACISGFTDPTAEYIQFLLDHGIDPTAKDSYGKTAYDYAIEQGLTEIADLLICA